MDQVRDAPPSGTVESDYVGIYVCLIFYASGRLLCVFTMLLLGS